MFKKILILCLFFYFLTLFQNSFLVHFNIFNLIPNFVLISVVVIVIKEKAKDNLGFFSAFIAGFFLDVFSQNFIGWNILILIGIVIAVKILKKYLRPVFGLRKSAINLILN
ncbi:MAG: rod shape-determining protein MreD [Candidatus Nealsonbacteria bacterium]|nr:rod shape-determining protein MreD [Candidatus Nealsonbacteria bacterium]